MKKSAVFGIAAMLHLSGCAFKTPEENPVQSNNNIPIATHDRNLETLVFGPWQGTIPCADCAGINYQLTLQKDRTYEESSEYLGKSDKPFLEKGTWLITEDSVVMLTKPSGQTQLRFSKGSLLMLDQQGQPVTSALAENYKLSRAGNGTNNTLEAKRRQGIDFVAIGNESSWVLDIDLDKSITFSSPNPKLKLVGTDPSEHQLPNGKGMVFRAKTEAGTLSVRVINETCTDKKSGKQLPYTVTVTANAMDYSGCGKFLNDENLNGDWAVTGMNGKPLNPEGLPKGAPTMQVNLENKQVAGNGGCNRFSGPITVKGTQISFGQMVSTKMACTGAAMKTETDFLNLLNGKTYNYETQGTTLRLKTGDQDMLVFKKGN